MMEFTVMSMRAYMKNYKDLLFFENGVVYFSIIQDI